MKIATFNPHSPFRLLHTGAFQGAIPYEGSDCCIFCILPTLNNAHRICS
jgi:hypothetical protein